jgi:hypothetical protein
MSEKPTSLLRRRMIEDIPYCSCGRQARIEMKARHKSALVLKHGLFCFRSISGSPCAILEVEARIVGVPPAIAHERQQ